MTRSMHRWLIAGLASAVVANLSLCVMLIESGNYFIGGNVVAALVCVGAIAWLIVRRRTLDETDDRAEE